MSLLGLFNSRLEGNCQTSVSGCRLHAPGYPDEKEKQIEKHKRSAGFQEFGNPLNSCLAVSLLMKYNPIFDSQNAEKLIDIGSPAFF